MFHIPVEDENHYFHAKHFLKCFINALKKSCSAKITIFLEERSTKAARDLCPFTINLLCEIFFEKVYYAYFKVD